MRGSLVGQKFGTLKIVSYEGVKNKNSYWGCECECGNKIVIARPNLVKKEGQICCGWTCGKVYSLKDQPPFGNLTVTGLAYMKNKTSYWNCDCVCGKNIVVKRGFLTDGRVRSCGCIRKGKTSANWTGHGDISGSLYARIKKRANKKDIPFGVTIEELNDLYENQKGKCALTGMEITLPGNSLTAFTASLDRIDSAKGYLPGNCQWVHKDVNFMKQSFSESYFIELCGKVVNWKSPIGS
jgi:hypothetical protein